MEPKAMFSRIDISGIKPIALPILRYKNNAALHRVRYAAMVRTAFPFSSILPADIGRAPASALQQFGPARAQQAINAENLTLAQCEAHIMQRSLRSLIAPSRRQAKDLRTRETFSLRRPDTLCAARDLVARCRAPTCAPQSTGVKPQRAEPRPPRGPSGAP